MSGTELCLPWDVTDDGDDYVIASVHEPVEVARVHHGQGSDDLAAFIVRAANEHIGLTRALHRVEGEARTERTRADAAEAECARLTTERGCIVAVLRHLADGMALDHAYPALAGVPVDVADALAAVVRQRDAARERHGAVEECADVFRRERDAARAEAAGLRAALATATDARESAGRVLYEHVRAKCAGIPSIDPEAQPWEPWEALPERKREVWRIEAATRESGAWGLP